MNLFDSLLPGPNQATTEAFKINLKDKPKEKDKNEAYHGFHFMPAFNLVTNYRLTQLFLSLLLILLPFLLPAQIIWQENFSSYPDGTQNSALWLTNPGDCDDGVDQGNSLWRVSGGRFVVKDTEGFNCSGNAGDAQSTFTTNPIDISSHQCVSISIDLDGAGALDCNFPGAPHSGVHNGHDQMVVEYSTTGGSSWVLLEYICGDTGLPTTATANNIQGTSLIIKITVGNKAQNEIYYFDNIIVQATSTTPALTPIGPFCSSDPSTPLSTTQSGITGSWSGNGVIGGNSFNPSTASVGPNTLTFTPNPGQCANTNTTSVTVNAGPDVNDIANQTACGSYILPAISGVNLSGTQAFYTASGGGGVQLLPGQVITTAATTTFFIYDSNGSCSDEEQFNVTITPAPTVNDLADPSVCGAYTLPAITGSNLSGGEAYYTLSGGNGTSFSAGQSITSTTTLFIYDGAGSCSDEEQVTITILPPPTVNDLANVSTCGSFTLPAITGTNLSGSEAYYTQSGGNGTSFNPGQNITSTTTLFIYDGTGACSDEEQVTITITSPPIVNDLANASACNSFTLPPITGINLTGGQAYYTQSGGNGTSFSPGQSITSTTSLFIYDGTTGCDDEEQVTITITSAPTVNDIANVSTCQSYTLPAITGTNLTGGQAYYSQSGGNGTSFSPGQAITSTTTLFIYDGVSGCDDQEQFTITINQPPTVNDIPNQTACDSYTLPPITGTNLSGGQAYYTASGGNGNTFNPGQTITSTTTLFIYDGVGGCDDQEQFTITITSAPNVLDFANQTACGSFTLPNISGSNLTGNQAYYTGPNGTGTRFNIGQQVTTSMSLFVYDGSPGCSDQEQFSITITPAPDIDFQPTQNVCGSLVLPPITGSNLSGTQAYYTGTSGSGTRFNPGDVIMNSITLFMYDGGGSCEDQELFSINISPQPDITDIADLSTCGSFTLPNITGTNLTGNEAYFSAAGGGGTSFNPGEVISATTTLFIYDGTTGCEDEEQVTITITSQPDIQDLADVTVCGSFTLPNITGTNLTGNEAYFSAAGGGGTSFNPGEVISATTTLFIYDGTTGCEDEEQVTITITSQPDIQDLADVTVCGSFTLPNITGTNLTGNEAYFSAAGGGGTSFSPGEVISATTTLFIYDGTTGCEDEEQFTITITSQPDINDLADVTVCGSFTLPNITGTNLTGNEAYFSAAGGGGTSFSPGEVISATTTLFIYDGTTGCEDEEQFTITITSQPDIQDLADVTVCGSFTLPNITGNNLTGNEAYFSAAGGGGTSFNPGEVISATTTLFIYDGTTGCEDEEQFTITITSQPDIQDIADVTVCGSFTLPNITGTNLTGNEAYFSAAGGGGTSFSPGEVISATTTLFIYDGTTGCEDEEQFTITIPEQPDIDALTNQSACGIFTLPAITGRNLTGNQAYYTATNGQGTSFIPGDEITQTMTLFIYDGASGCEDEEVFTITIIPAPVLDPVDEQTACSRFILPPIAGNNLSGNEAYFSLSGGSGIQLNPGDEVTNTSTLFIYDRMGNCESEIEFTITILAQPQIDDIPDQVSCESFILPVITGVNLSGNEAYFSGPNGTGDNFQEGQIITESQVFFIWDISNGCNSQQVFEVTIHPNPDVLLLPTAIACAGDEIGQINTNVIAGTGPFTYDWNFDQYDDLATLTDIGAGTYSLTLSDANSCNVVASIELNEPAPLTLSCEESAPVSTIGGNDGAAAITLSGGSGPYTLDWENEGISGSQTEAGTGSTTIDLLTAGNYSLMLTDANNCNTSCTFTITDPACRLRISTTAQEVSCNDAEDGTISITLSDGQGPFTFTWNDPNLNGIQNPDNLPAGDYMVTVVDDNACEAVASATIAAPPPLSLTGLSTTPISTIGASDGGVSVNYQGGTAPYQISWAGPIFGSLASPSSGVFAIDVFPPGDYTLRVEDEQGCTEVIDFVIPGVNCSLSVEVTGNDLSCFEDQSGRIQLTINGGISPMTIDWNVDSLDGLRTLQNLVAGDYQVIVTDANGCQASDSISLTEPTPLSLICTPTEVVSSPGASDGAVTIEVAGGVPNYTVDWTNGIIDGSENLFIPGTITINNLNAGDYNIFLFDNNSCMASCGLTVEEDCPATSSLLSTTLCSGDSIQVNGNFYHQGNPSGVEVLLNANSLGCDSTVTIDLQFFEAAVATVNRDVCRGESIQIGNMTFDENNTSGQVLIPNASPDGCDSMITVTINLIDAPVFFLEGATTICRGEAATLTFRASNYSDPVGLNIISDNGEVLTLTDMVDGATFTVNPALTSTYSIASTDGMNLNCPIVLQGEVVIAISGPQVNLLSEDYNGFQLSCANANDGAITAQIEGGIPPFNYQWNNGQQTDRLTQLPEGFYELTVTDNIGCEGFGEALLSGPTAIVADIIPISPGCNGAAGQIRIDNITGGVGPYEVSLDGATYTSISSFPFALDALEPGNYQLRLRGLNACESSFDIQIANEDPLLLDLGEDRRIKFGESITITALTNFDVAQIEWMPTDSIILISTNEISVSPTRTTVYTAQAFDAAGCSISDEITITVDRGIDLFRPTVFSPNNDGINDVFQVFAGPAIMAINVFQVYDRWGNILYDVKTVAPNDPSVGWDGTYRGQAMNAGVYVYYLEVTLVDGRTEVFKGDVALLR